MLSLTWLISQSPTLKPKPNLDDWIKHWSCSCLKQYEQKTFYDIYYHDACTSSRHVSIIFGKCPLGQPFLQNKKNKLFFFSVYSYGSSSTNTTSLKSLYKTLNSRKSDLFIKMSKVVGGSIKKSILWYLSWINCCLIVFVY